MRISAVSVQESLGVALHIKLRLLPSLKRKGKNIDLSGCNCGQSVGFIVLKSNVTRNYSPLRLSTSLPRWIYNRFFMSVEA